MSRSPFKIHQVDPSHQDVRDDIDRMHRVCFPDYDVVQPLGDWWFVYQPKGVQPIGFAGLWPSQRTAGAGYLCRAGLMPEARGHGLQKRLIRVREREARRKRWLTLFSDTAPMNAHSMNNLIECGFRPFVPSVPWSGTEWVYLRKIIDEGVA